MQQPLGFFTESADRSPWPELLHLHVPELLLACRMLSVNDLCGGEAPPTPSAPHITIISKLDPCQLGMPFGDASERVVCYKHEHGT